MQRREGTQQSQNPFSSGSMALKVSARCCLPKLGLANLENDSKVDLTPSPQLLCNRSTSGLELVQLAHHQRHGVGRKESTRLPFRQHPRFCCMIKCHLVREAFLITVYILSTPTLTSLSRDVGHYRVGQGTLLQL